MTSKFVNLTNLTLLVALSLSTVAAYYSIIGLTAIFAGAVIPIIIMGTMLEIAKITTTVWLRKYWSRASWVIKSYLVPAVILLALLTSMGIFGFLSKAHSDQGLVSGDAQSKLAIYDEKIKTQRDNIELARKALQQMDAQVDARLSRGDSEAGAERAVQIRRQQQGERAKLQKEIVDAQKEISKLNEERAPIAAENRKIEAEVGPIKYIAAFIYGDNPDSNLLERAVRWVIILLVIVFDPLAIALVLAANSSKDWDKSVQDDVAAMNIDPEPKDVFIRPFTDDEINALDKKYEPDDGPLNDVQSNQLKESAIKFTDPGEHPDDKFEHELTEVWPFPEPVIAADNDLGLKETMDDNVLDKHPYLNEPFVHFTNTKPMVVQNEKPKEKKPRTRKKKIIPDVERPGDYLTNDNTYIVKAKDTPYPWQKIDNDYISYEGRVMRKEALQSLKPELFMLTADHNRDIKTNFGLNFPTTADKGDMFVRVDMLPNKVFKYDGNRWIEVNKEKTDTYLYNEKYVQYLIDKVDRGQYDIELLNENEKSQIEEYLRKNKS